VTAHSDVGLPTIWATKADLETALAVVAQLTSPHATRIPDAVVAAHFNAAGANLRETLFRLYDYWQGEFRQAELRQGDAEPRVAAGDCSD
jgi:hypothetical protein